MSAVYFIKYESFYVVYHYVLHLVVGIFTHVNNAEMNFHKLKSAIFP